MSDLKKALLGLRLAIDDLLKEEIPANKPIKPSIGVMVGDVWGAYGRTCTVKSIDAEKDLVYFDNGFNNTLSGMGNPKNWQLLCRPQPLPTKHESSKIEDPLSGVMVGDHQWAFNQGNPPNHSIGRFQNRKGDFHR